MTNPAPAVANADGCSAGAGGVINVDRRSGYCAATRTFRSLRPPVPLPPADVPLSFPAFAFSLLPSPLPAYPALIDTATGEAVSFPAFLSQVRALAGALRSRVRLGRGNVAFVLAPARLDVPVLYFALLSIGAVVSPANPALTAAEVAVLVALSGASVAFAVSSTAANLPAGLATVLLDSDRFRSFLHNDDYKEESALDTVVVRQSETAAIQYSSGTTGRVKAAALPHRSFIAMVAGSHALFEKPTQGRERVLLGAPMFHSMGFYFTLKGVAMSQTTVVMTDAVAPRGVKGMMEAAERWAVAEMTASPPVVVGMAKARCNLEALQRVICGGAPLSRAAAESFRRRFPKVDLCMAPGGKESIKTAKNTSIAKHVNAKKSMIKPKNPEVGKWKVNEVKKHDKVEKFKPTFKQLLSKYKKDKAVQTYLNRPSGAKRSRSPSRQGVHNHHQIKGG